MIGGVTFCQAPSLKQMEGNHSGRERWTQRDPQLLAGGSNRQHRKGTVQTTEPQSYSGFPGIPINGLTIDLPAAGKYFNVAVVTVNLPNLVVTNCTSNSATITLVGDSPAGVVFGYATVGCDTPVATSGPKPVTIVLKVPLGSTAGAAFPDWEPAPGSTISTSTFASISALLVKE
jgi:hypothetical protein